MLIKRRSLPSSPLIWVPRAGNVWSISAIRPGRFCAAESNCLRPSVWRVKAAGRVTLIAMIASCNCQFRFCDTVELAQVGIEVSQARANGTLFPVVSGQCVSGFKAVAGDARNGKFVGRDATAGIETSRYGSGDAARSLGEDALRFGQFLNAGDKFDVGDIFSPTAGGADHLRCGGAVRWIADGQRA